MYENHQPRENDRYYFQPETGVPVLSGGVDRAHGHPRYRAIKQALLSENIKSVREQNRGCSEV